MKRLRICDWFYFFVAIALASRVAEDLLQGRWQIHSGEFFPWHHFPSIPLAPPWLLAVEWLGFMICGLGLLYPASRSWAARGASLVLILSLSQLYQNQKMLLFLICLALSLESIDRPSGRPVVWLLRWQLAMVYGFTAIHKIFEGFQDGHVLVGLARYLSEEPSQFILRRAVIEILREPAIARLASFVTLGIEFALPILLFKKPRLGILAVVALHIGFSFVMLDVLSFSFAMIALSLLFLESEVSGEGAIGALA